MSVTSTQPPKGRARGIALVIGNASYRAAPKLANPLNDARDIDRSLRQMGFDIIGGNSAGLDLDRACFADRVKEFARRAAKYDVALFYYAGHGIQLGGNNYMVPIDAAPETEADIGLELIALQAVISNTVSDDRTTVVILDACRNNPFLEPLERSLGTRSAQVKSGLAETPAGADTIIAFATQPDHVAYDGSGRNGVFTDALLVAFGRPDRDIEVVLREVRGRVIETTTSMSRGAQIPWSHSSLLREKFSLTGRFEDQPAGEAKTSEKTPHDPPPPAAAGGIAPGHSTSVTIRDVVNSTLHDIGCVTTTVYHGRVQR